MRNARIAPNPLVLGLKDAYCGRLWAGAISLPALATVFGQPFGGALRCIKAQPTAQRYLPILRPHSEQKSPYQKSCFGTCPLIYAPAALESNEKRPTRLLVAQKAYEFGSPDFAGFKRAETFYEYASQFLVGDQLQ
jgi:hypothetical protein